jgi:hypothetical protein
MLRVEKTLPLIYLHTMYEDNCDQNARVLGLPRAQNFGKKIAATFSKKNSLSRYDAARPRFSPYGLCGARRIFGDPMALIRFTATFSPTRFRPGGAPKIFSGQNPRADFPNFFPYHGMMPHSPVFRPTSHAALDDSLATPWRLFVLRPLFLQLAPRRAPPEGIHIFTLYA